MKSQYRPDVSVHLQDQAVFDAADTMKRFIEASIASSHMRGKVFARYQGPQRRYAYWLLRRYERIGAVLQGKTPTPEPFDVAPSDRKDAMRFVRRSLRQSLGTPPRVRVRFALDSTLYRVFEERGQQYIAITSTTPGKRVVLPLCGSGRITGNVRVVLHPRSRSVSIHTTDDVKVPEPRSSAGCIGLDAGVTEVIASSTGYKYGRGYGKLLDRITDETMRTGKARNKLHQLAKKAEAKGDGAKASRIRRNNLGRKQLAKQRAQDEAAIRTIVGEAVRQALATSPAVVVVEDLTHMRGRTKNRKLSRLVSRWARSALKDRLEFRTEAGGSRLETVNAAYTSQTCPNPTCGSVHQDNRHGDRFHCLQCGWDGGADVVAGMNLLQRWDDPEIRLWTPKEQVKAILMERFRRRKETLRGTPLPAGL